MVLQAFLAGHRIDPVQGTIEGGHGSERRLSDLVDAFLDADAASERAASDNPVVYRVSTLEGPQIEGALSIGVGWLAPGTVGQEYFLTRGHFHAWRPAAEFYLGLSGEGAMVLESDEGDRVVRLAAGEVVYVPGDTAHRTVNTGDTPLVYAGIYPALAGHDYGSIAETNFRQVVLASPDGPRVALRTEVAGLS